MNLRLRLLLPGLIAVAIAVPVAKRTGSAWMAVLPAALGCAAAAEVMAVRHPRRQERPPAPAPVPPDATRNIRLAREYVEGVTVLVEVSIQHKTPIPSAAAKNLRYLTRLLDDAETGLRGRTEDDVVEVLPEVRAGNA
jgi:hypothetical protein